MAGLRCRSSGLIYGDDSTGFADQEETSRMDAIKWTNEKHSMYINSMEASFINQLYNSKDLFNWCPQQDRGFDVKLGSPPGQSKARKHEYGAFLANPYAHFRETNDDAFDGNISRMSVDKERHQVSASFNEEVSDQNFINEDYEIRAGQRGKRLRRMRTIDASGSNDQVVPWGITHFSMQDHCYEGNSN